MGAIGLAAAAQAGRDGRTTEHVIMFAIVLAAAAGLARDGQARSLARLVAWDRRRALRA